MTARENNNTPHAMALREKRKNSLREALDTRAKERKRTYSLPCNTYYTNYDASYLRKPRHSLTIEQEKEIAVECEQRTELARKVFCFGYVLKYCTKRFFERQPVRMAVL